MSEQQQRDNTAKQQTNVSRRRFLLGLVTAGMAYSAPTLLGLDEARAYTYHTYRSPRSRHTYHSPRSRHSYYGHPSYGGYQGAPAAGGYHGPSGGAGGYRGGPAPAHGGGFRTN